MPLVDVVQVIENGLQAMLHIRSESHILLGNVQWSTIYNNGSHGPQAYVLVIKSLCKPIMHPAHVGLVLGADHKPRLSMSELIICSYGVILHAILSYAKFDVHAAVRR